jgi:ClpP class serine protease
MAKRREPVDELLDALVWMRRKAKKHAPVDDLIDALVTMRRQAKKKLAKRKVKVKKPLRSKRKRTSTKSRPK